jgi:hypothetical protein
MGEPEQYALRLAYINTIVSHYRKDVRLRVRLLQKTRR